MADIRTFIAVNASQRVTNNVARLIPRLESSQAGYRWVDNPSATFATPNCLSC